MATMIGSVLHGCRVVFVVLSFASSLLANSIFFTDSGVGSGVIGSTQFSNGAFTIHATGDIAHIVGLGHFFSQSLQGDDLNRWCG